MATLKHGRKVSALVAKSGEGRPVLESAILAKHGEDWFLEATDSYKLARVKLEQTEDDGLEKGARLPIGILKALEKGTMGSRPVLRLEVEQVEGDETYYNRQVTGRAIVLMPDGSEVSEPLPVEGAFPDVGEIVPALDEAGETLTLGVNAALLAEAAAALCGTGKKSGFLRIVIRKENRTNTNTPNGGAAVATMAKIVVRGDDPDELGIVMPVRLEDHAGWELEKVEESDEDTVPGEPVAV
jgi:hypothetical protein